MRRQHLKYHVIYFNTAVAAVKLSLVPEMEKNMFFHYYRFFVEVTYLIMYIKERKQCDTLDLKVGHNKSLPVYSLLANFIHIYVCRHIYKTSALITWLLCEVVVITNRGYCLNIFGLFLQIIKNLLYRI